MVDNCEVPVVFPREERTGQMRSRILDAAVRLFGELGYEGTSLQAIADEVGIAKPSLLYHFRSKRDLRNQVLNESLAHWESELPRVLSAAKTGSDRFSSTIRALVAFFLEDSNRARLTVRELLDRPEDTQRRIKQRLAPWIKLITDYIRLGQKLGMIRPEVQPESYIVQVMMMVVGTVGIGGVIAGIVDNPDMATTGQRVAELERIARCSLFVENRTNTKRKEKEK